MSDEFLPFRSAAATLPPPATQRRSHLGYAGFSFFTRLSGTLRAARRLLDACTAARAAESRRVSGWGVPSLFFFDRDAEAARTARRSAPAFPEPYRSRLAARFPAESLAWDQLPRLLDDALTLLPASVETRRAARALVGLVESVAAFAPFVPAAGELVGLLAVPDDQVVLAVHPAARVGVRVLVRGVADMHQLHVLLADVMTGDPARGLLAGRRPDPRIVDAYRDADPHPDAAVATARFQLFHPAALRPDGTLPAGFTGTDHWFWGDESPAALPLENGERVVLLGQPVVEATWDVGRKFRRLPAEAERIAVLTRPEVDRWLLARCPRLTTATAAGKVAA